MSARALIRHPDARRVLRAAREEGFVRVVFRIDPDGAIEITCAAGADEELAPQELD